MRTFLTFLFEANAVGSKFEKQTADMVNMWLKKIIFKNNMMSGVFSQYLKIKKFAMKNIPIFQLKI